MIRVCLRPCTLVGPALWTVQHTTDLHKYSIQMPYLLFTPYHLM